MTSPAVITARDLGKCYQIYDHPLDRLKQSLWRGRRRFYREFWALRNVGFDVTPGETVGIIGANGSGKSTLLQLICGILRPTEGSLGVNGRISSLLELGAGFNPEFTGRENVYMTAAITGLSRAETDRRYQAIVDFADIGDFISQPVKIYSSGMFVRLAFAAAVSVSPDILVVDEALAVGDVRFQQKCMARIRQFCRSGTVIIVSHDMTAIVELCSRAIWIEAGRTRMDGTPKSVVEKYMEFMYAGDGTGHAPSLPPEEVSAEDSSRAGLLAVGEELRQFGDRRVTIEAVGVRSLGAGSGVIGAGHACEITMIVHAHASIAHPIVGFMVNDRLGRIIFGDNTNFLKPPLAPLAPGKRYVVTFRLDPWPNIAGATYTLSVAVADGVMEQHTACHWIHDAAVFESIPIRMPVGIFSVPDTEVRVQEAKS